MEIERPGYWAVLPASVRYLSPQGGYPYPQNCGEPSPQNCGVFNRKNNKSIEHTPLPPRAKVSEEVQSVLKSYVGNDRELAQLLVDFLDARVKLKKPLQTARAAKILVNKLDKLSGGDRALKIALLDNAILHNWTSVYPLKADELPRAGTEDAGARMPLRGEGVQYL